MTKKICISISDRTYKQYIRNYSGNKSRFIEDNFLEGIDSALAEVTNYKVKLYELTQELRNREDEIKRLKLENASLKAKVSKEKPEGLVRAEQLVRSLRYARQ